MATGVFQAAFWQGAADQQGHGGVAVTGDGDWDTLGHPRSSTASVTSARLLLTGQSGEQVNLFPSSISGAEEKNISLINKPVNALSCAMTSKVLPTRNSHREPPAPQCPEAPGVSRAQAAPWMLRKIRGCSSSPRDAWAVLVKLRQS